MNILIILLTLTAVSPLLNGAAFQDKASEPEQHMLLQEDSSKRERNESDDFNELLKRRCSLSCSSSSSIEPTMAVPGMYTLTSSDEQKILIPAPTALKYSAFMQRLLEFDYVFSTQPGYKETGRSTIDLSSFNLSGEALQLLASLMVHAEILEDTPETNSSLRLAQSITCSASLAAVKELLNVVEALELKTIITDAIANITVMNFGKMLSVFESLSPIARSAIAKQLFLILPKDTISIEWQQGQNEIAFGVSVEDLTDHNKLPPIYDGGLTFFLLNVNDLTGLNQMPDKETVRWLYLYYSHIQTIASDALVGFDNLERLLVNNNQLKSIAPNAFKNLTNLKELWLNHNQLETFPAGLFANLGKLKRFFLCDNQITDHEERARIVKEVKTASSRADVRF